MGERGEGCWRKTYDTSGLVYRAREGVDGDNMRGFIVPRTILQPVGGGDFGPGVIEGTGGRENLHCGFRVMSGGE